jgi:hypothetical protein
MRLRGTALKAMVLVPASGCGGRLGVGSVDAARAACLEAARKKGDQPIETYNVRSLGEGVTRCPCATGARSAPLLRRAPTTRTPGRHR